MSKRGAGRPEGGYRNPAGETVPRITTIIGRCKDSGGLVYIAKKHWHEAGRRGLPFERDAYWGKPETWGVEATEVGSIVHQGIEDTLHRGQAAGIFDEVGAAEAEAGRNLVEDADDVRIVARGAQRLEDPLDDIKHLSNPPARPNGLWSETTSP